MKTRITLTVLLASLFLLNGCDNFPKVYNPDNYEEKSSCKEGYLELDFLSLNKEIEVDSVLELKEGQADTFWVLQAGIDLLYRLDIFLKPEFGNIDKKLNIKFSESGLLNDNKTDTAITPTKNGVHHLYLKSPEKQGRWELSASIGPCSNNKVLVSNFNQLNSSFNIKFDSDTILGGGVGQATLTADISTLYKGNIAIELTGGQLLNVKKSSDNAHYNITPLNGSSKLKFQSPNPPGEVTVKAWPDINPSLVKTANIQIDEAKPDTIFKITEVENDPTEVVNTPSLNTISITANGIDENWYYIWTASHLRDSSFTIVPDKDLNIEIPNKADNNNLRSFYLKSPSTIIDKFIELTFNGYKRKVQIKSTFSEPDSAYFTADKDTISFGDSLELKLNFIKETGKVTDDILITVQALISEGDSTKSITGLDKQNFFTRHTGALTSYPLTFIAKDARISSPVTIEAKSQDSTISQTYNIFVSR